VDPGPLNLVQEQKTKQITNSSESPTRTGIDRVDLEPPQNLKVVTSAPLFLGYFQTTGLIPCLQKLRLPTLILTSGV
jgi:hypothetical protein